MKNFNLFSNKHFRFVAVLCLLLSLCVGNAWGETYVMYPNNGSTFNSSWSKTSRTARVCYSNITTYGLQLMGENSGTYGEVSSNSTFTGISAISVSATATGSKNLELYYSANGSSWTKLTQVSVSKDPDKYNTYNYTLTGLPSTAIYIKFRAASGSIYIYSITVTTGSTYTLTFKDPDGTTNGSTTSISAKATTFGFGASAPSKTGYHITGFYKEAGLSNKIADPKISAGAVVGGDFCASTDYTNSSSQYTAGANHDLYLQWAINHYTITYDKGENGTGDAISNGDKTHGTNFTLSSSTYSRVGYTQTGWSTTDGGDKAYNLGGTYSTDADITLYPYWEQNRYTVSFSTGTGNPTQANIQEASGGSGITLPDGPIPDCSDDGWVFAGWSETEYTTEPYVTNVGRLRMPGDYFYPDDDVTLYAVYRKLTSGTSTATYTANSRSNLTLIATSGGVDYWWYHTATGVEFYIESYGIYYDEFDIYNSKGSDNNGWALLDAHRPITTISFTKTSSDALYASLSSSEPGAGTVTLDGSTITCTGSVTKVVLETSTDQYSDVMLSTFTVTYKNCKFLSNPSCCTKHDITLASSGSVTGGTFTTSAASACEGAEVTLTATPSDGYAFAGWTVTNTSGGADVTDAVLGAGHAGDNPATMTMPEQAVTVNATFATLTGITVKTAPTKTTYCEGDYFDPTGLVITASFSNSTSLDIPYAGNEAKFTFSPTTSTALTTGNSSVSISYGGQSTSQAITVNAHRTISLTGSGTVTGGTFTADESSACVGATITIEVSAADHYSFNSWTIEKAGGGTVTPVSATSASTTFIMPDANVTVTASFNEDAYKTVCFKNNGVGIAGYTTQKVYVGSRPTAPTLTDGYGTGDACDETSDKHYGWTQETWTSTIANKSTIDARTGSEAVYAKNANLPTVAAEDPSTIYYHAVWAEGTAAPTINTTLIAKWDKCALTASTAVKAKDKDGNTLNSVTMTPNVTLNTSETYTYSIANISTYPEIILTGFNLSSYNSGSMSFVIRGSSEADIKVYYSTDNETSYKQLGSNISHIAKKEYTYEATGIPNDATHIKIYYNSNSGNFYFGTVRLWGVKTSPTYTFTELNSTNTSGWTGSDWEGYYIITGKYSTYPEYALGGGVGGIGGLRVVSPSDGTITTGDVGLIYKVTYKSTAPTGYSIQAIASGDYLGDALVNGLVSPDLEAYYHEVFNYNTIRYTSSSNYIQFNYNNGTYPRFGSYTGSMTNPKLYKILSSYSTFRTTCCTTYDITLDGGGTISGAGTFSAGVDAACATETVTLSKTICDGYTVGSWTVHKTGDESTTVTVTSNQFTMPAYGVTVKLSTTIKTSHFIDKLHRTDGYTDDGYAVSGCDQTVPTLSDASAPGVGETGCEEVHYKFVGWVPEANIASDGTLTGSPTILEGGTTDWDATGTDYVAVWAKIK